MNILKRGRVALLALFLAPLLVRPALAQSVAHGEIAIRGAIVEAAHCQPVSPSFGPSVPSVLPVQCEHARMAGLVTAIMESRPPGADEQFLVWTRSGTSRNGVMLRQAAASEHVYRVTLTYL